MRRLALLLVLASLASLMAACSQPGDGGYVVTTTFARATSLFEESRVKVMGLDVGHVERIAIEGDRIRVDLRIERDVPLPADVEAAIMPLTLIGERNVVLHPAWTPGDERLEDGAEIPPARTHVAVEPDDVLETVVGVTDALDPHRLGSALSEAADALDGRGQQLNDAAAQGARLARLLREHDDSLLAAADGLDQLARTLNAREDQLTALVDAYAEATEVLAAERSRLRPFLSELLALMEEGELVLTAYEDHLAEDLADLSEIALTLEVNTDSVERLAAALPDVADMLVAAYRPGTQAIKLRFTGGPTLTTLLEQLAGLLGLELPACLPVPTVTCEPAP